MLADIEKSTLDEAEASIAATGAEAASLVTDVSDGRQMDALADATRDAFGTAHVVCNNAGVGAGGFVWEVSEADWKWVLGVNLWGVIHGVRAFVPMLVAQNEGHVVNTASMAGMLSAPMMGPYTVSKHGVVSLTETLHGDLQLSGSAVSCSVLCPSWVNTRLYDSERNRPEALANPAGDGDGFSVTSPEVLRQILSTGMEPEKVASAVADAIVDDTFYILTHDDSDPAIRARFDAIAARKSPAGVAFPV